MGGADEFDIDLTYTKFTNRLAENIALEAGAFGAVTSIIVPSRWCWE